MAKEVKLLVTGDVVWTLVGGELTGWKIASDGVPVQLANWERSEALEKERNV